MKNLTNENYVLDIKKGDKRIYVSFNLTVKTEGNYNNNKVKASQEVHKSFLDAFNFGIDYYLFKTKTNHSNLKITINDFSFLPIDTTPMVVFFAIIDFLCKKNEYIIGGFGIDANGNFVIPK